MSIWAPLQIEYNLLRSHKNHLEVLDIHQTDQGNYPTCMIWYPPLTKELFLLISNSGYKVKLFNSSTKMCRYARGLPLPQRRLQSLSPRAWEPRGSHGFCRGGN